MQVAEHHFTSIHKIVHYTSNSHANLISSIRTVNKHTISMSTINFNINAAAMYRYIAQIRDTRQCYQGCDNTKWIVSNNGERPRESITNNVFRQHIDQHRFGHCLKRHSLQESIKLRSCATFAWRQLHSRKLQCARTAYRTHKVQHHSDYTQCVGSVHWNKEYYFSLRPLVQTQRAILQLTLLWRRLTASPSSLPLTRCYHSKQRSICIFVNPCGNILRLHDERYVAVCIDITVAYGGCDTSISCLQCEGKFLSSSLYPGRWEAWSTMTFIATENASLQGSVGSHGNEIRHTTSAFRFVRSICPGRVHVQIIVVVSKRIIS